MKQLINLITTSIANKIVTSVLMVFLLVYGLSISYVYLKARDDILKSVKQETLSTAQIIAVAIYRNYEIPRDFREIQSYIIGTKRYKKNILSLNVISREYKIISSTDNKLLLKTAKGIEFRDVLQQNSSIIELNENDPAPSIRIVYPVSAGLKKSYKATGVIELVTSLEPHLEYLSKIQRNILISGILIITAIFIVIMKLSQAITRPINSLYDGIKKVDQGNFSVTVPVQSNDEIGFLAEAFNRMVIGLQERFKLTRFVSQSTLEHVKSDHDIRLGGKKKFLTVLFSDIRGFTSFSENHEPEYVVEKLNLLMNFQADIIQENGGDIDKFVGDEVMAVFEGEDMALRACRAALSICELMEIRNQATEDRFFVGIGINTGEMISGNMGSYNRIDRTVIGDAVNLGARLVSRAGKNEIILSDATYKLVKGDIEFIEHEPVAVKGKEKKITIYTLTGLKK